MTVYCVGHSLTGPLTAADYICSIRLFVTFRIVYCLALLVSSLYGLKISLGTTQFTSTLSSSQNNSNNSGASRDQEINLTKDNFSICSYFSLIFRVTYRWKIAWTLNWDIYFTLWTAILNSSPQLMKWLPRCDIFFLFFKFLRKIERQDQTG